MKKITILFGISCLFAISLAQNTLPPINTFHTFFALDSLDRVVGVMDSNNFEITLAYDPVGNIIFQSKTIVSGSLPVDLLSFEAFAKDEDVLCKWTTVREVNMDYYDVEWSEDGVNYAFIGRKEAVGNSNGREKYTFLHPDPVIGANYYRLKMFSMDGSSKPSNIELVNFYDSHIHFDVYPNPTNGVFYIEIKDNEDAAVTIIDALGQVIYQSPMTTEQLAVDLSNRAAGVYYVNVRIGNHITAKKVLKR